jgi:hypothetical protein
MKKQLSRSFCCLFKLLPFVHQMLLDWLFDEKVHEKI